MCDMLRKREKERGGGGRSAACWISFCGSVERPQRGEGGREERLCKVDAAFDKKGGGGNGGTALCERPSSMQYGGKKSATCREAETIHRKEEGREGEMI